MMKQYSLENLAVGKLEYGSGASAIPFDGITRYVRITDIDDDGKLNTDSVSPNTIEGKYILNDGDILFARTGATVGKSYQYHNSDGRCQYAGYLIRLIPNKEIVRPDYIWFFTKSPQYWRFINSSMKIVAQPNINAKQYGSLKLQVPTLEEQDIVISRLTKSLEIIKRRKEQIRLYDELIKARFVEMFGEPIDNPLNWPVKKMKDLSSLITNGNTPKGGSENYVDHGIVFLRSQNVWRNRIDLSDVAYIDEETHGKLKKSSIHHNDILITKTGRINTENSSLGRAALYTGEDNGANINGHVYLIRLKKGVDPRFVVTILTGEAYRRYIRKVCVGGIDKRQINLDQVEDFPIILPPIEQQVKFSEFVEQVDKSKSVVQKSLNEVQLLFDSLMQQYFG